MNTTTAKLMAFTVCALLGSMASAQVVINSELVTPSAFGRGTSLSEGESKTIKLGRAAFIEKVTLSLKANPNENQIVNILVNGRIKGTVNLPMNNVANDFYIGETASEIDVMLAAGKKVELQGAIFLWSATTDLERHSIVRSDFPASSKTEAGKALNGSFSLKDSRLIVRLRDSIRPIARIMTIEERIQLLEPVEKGLRIYEDGVKTSASESALLQAKEDLQKSLDALMPVLTAWSGSNEPLVSRSAMALRDVILEMKKK